MSVVLLRDPSRAETRHRLRQINKRARRSGKATAREEAR